MDSEHDRQKDLELFVNAMYRKLEPFVEVLSYQVLSSSKIAEVLISGYVPIPLWLK